MKRGYYIIEREGFHHVCYYNRSIFRGTFGNNNVKYVQSPMFSAGLGLTNDMDLMQHVLSQGEFIPNGQDYSMEDYENLLKNRFPEEYI